MESDLSQLVRVGKTPLYAGPDVKIIHNTTKSRMETWKKSGSYWYLWDVAPGRVWRERFMGDPIIAAAVLGLDMELPWQFNGRRNGAVDPDATCFNPANEIGGGLSMDVVAGGQDNDYTAIHWGDNYPTDCSYSPHMKVNCALVQITNVAHLCGLVDSTRPAANAAFAYPDNGIYFLFDTDNDNDAHLIIRSGGADQSDTNLGNIIAGTHYSICMRVHDDGETISAFLDDVLVLDSLDISGVAYAGLRAAQLQPYFATVNRAAAQLRQSHLHDFRLVMDAGF